MNAYDERAIAKGIGTGLGMAVGGPIGATVGNALGTFAGNLLFKPKTSYVRNDTFSSSVDPSLAYRNTEFGKGYVNGFSAMKEKETDFSTILSTASDMAPMVAGGLGMKDGFKLGGLFSKTPSAATDVVANTTEQISSVVELPEVVVNANKVSTIEKLGNYVSKANDIISPLEKSYNRYMKEETEGRDPITNNTPVDINTNAQTNDNTKVIPNYGWKEKSIVSNNIQEEYSNRLVEEMRMTDGIRGMIKSKMAIESEFGNPSAQRMTQVSPQQKYLFTGNEYSWDKKLLPKGGMGTHMINSYINIVRPNIQDINGQLQFINGIPGPSKEDMIMNTEQDAINFGEYYKYIAPMMRNWNNNY